MSLAFALVAAVGIGVFLGHYIRHAQTVSLTEPENWCNLHGHKWRREISGYRQCVNCGHVAYAEASR